MNLQENIRRILKEETSDYISTIKNILELTIMKDYEDFICDINVFVQQAYVKQWD